MTDYREVYVVTSGDDDDYQIQHVFASHAMAAQYVAVQVYPENFSIEPWPLLSDGEPIVPCRLLRVSWTQPTGREGMGIKHWITSNTLDAVGQECVFYAASYRDERRVYLVRIAQGARSDQWWEDHLMKMAQDLFAWAWHEETVRGQSIETINQALALRIKEEDL